MKRAKPPLAGGFTLVEILCVAALIALLATLLLPAAQRAFKTARATASANNLRQIGAGLGVYLGDHDGVYPRLRDTSVPAGNFWSQALTPYLAPPATNSIYLRNPPDYYVSRTFMDPLLPSGRHHFLGDYGANTRVFREPPTVAPLLRTIKVEQGSQLVAVMTAECTFNGKTVGSWEVGADGYIAAGYGNPPQLTQPSPRANGNVLALFCDGHLEAVPLRQFDDNRKTYLWPQFTF